MTQPKLPSKDDLKQVPELSLEDILEARRVYLQTLGVDVSNWTPSDPINRNQSAASYREFLLRQEINNQPFTVLLPWAQGAWLDQLSDTFYRNLPRLDGESDDAYRKRLQESPEFWSQAGATGKYYTVAKAVSAEIKALAWEEMPQACEATIHVLTHTGDGTASPELLESIRQSVMDDGVRWNTDVIATASATILSFTLEAKLETVTTDPDKQAAILASAGTELDSYLDSQHKFNGQVTVSGLHKALMVDGVSDVTLVGFAPVKAGAYEVPYCTAKTLTVI